MLAPMASLTSKSRSTTSMSSRGLLRTSTSPPPCATMDLQQLALPHCINCCLALSMCRLAKWGSSPTTCT